jgi:DNA-binding transcriptional LysR family regulator
VIVTVLWPRLAAILPQHPDLHVKINSNCLMTDVAPDRCDNGIRYGNQVEKDVIAVRLTANVPMVKTVASIGIAMQNVASVNVVAGLRPFE